MKRRLISLTISLLSFVSIVQAQYEDLPNGLTIKYVGTDYYTPSICKQAKNDTLGLGFFDYYGGVKTAFSNMRSALEIGYTQRITNYLNFHAPIRFGSVNKLAFSPKYDNSQLDVTRYFLSADATLQLAYMRKGNWLAPYVMAGLGGTWINKESFDMQIPVGLGLNARISDNLHLQLQTEYRFPLSTNENAAMHHSLGFLILLGEGKGVEKEVKVSPPPPPPPPPAPAPAPAPVPAPPADGDKDGIADVDDECPTVAGSAKFNGCPDSDGDGFADKNDNCPDVAGAVNGCPDTDGDGFIDKNDRCPTVAGPDGGCPEAPKVVDSDNDGVQDKDDKCPRVAGLAKFGGCPDTDNDGVEDAKDKCPTTAGLMSNAGCPEIKKEDKAVLEFAKQAVEFETGKAVLLSTSNATLDKIADIMRKYPEYSLRISGHTDDVGADAANQTLSQNRAKSCYDYLISKGVNPSKVTYAGYGETQPVGDNKTKEGRQKNRRVEFDVYLK